MKDKKQKIAPNLSHRPVITVDYEKMDAAGDAKFLSIGRSLWNPEEFSAKIYRWVEKSQRWSPQGEEVTLWRVLDLAILLVATVKNKPSYLNEFVQKPQDICDLRDFIDDNMHILAPRVEELRRLLNT